MDAIEKWLINQATFEPDPEPGGIGVMGAQSRNDGILIVATRWHNLSVEERSALISESYAIPAVPAAEHETDLSARVDAIQSALNLYGGITENLLDRVRMLEESQRVGGTSTDWGHGEQPG